MKSIKIALATVLLLPATVSAQNVDISEDERLDTDTIKINGDDVNTLVPGVHIVRDGDTLWDICVTYFSDPWRWPKVWSYNPSITNPHWIFPGDIIRLRKGGSLPVVTKEPGDVRVSSRRLNSGSVEVQKIAFVGKEDFKRAMRIVGSPHDKTMLAAGDTLYLTYDPTRKPKVGQKIAIYDETRAPVHPTSKDQFGKYVRIVGTAEVRSVQEIKKDGKVKNLRARAYVMKSHRVIERGMRAGPVRTVYKLVDPVANAKTISGKVIGIFDRDHLIGQSQIVFLNLKKKDGVKVGNRLCVVRRGDGYSGLMAEPGYQVGKNDKQYPARAIGDVAIVEVGEDASIGYVVSATLELGIGDNLVMIRGKKSCSR